MKRLLIAYALWSLELLGEECGCILSHHQIMDPRLGLHTLELLACTAQK